MSKTKEVYLLQVHLDDGFVNLQFDTLADRQECIKELNGKGVSWIKSVGKVPVPIQED